MSSRVEVSNSSDNGDPMEIIEESDSDRDSSSGSSDEQESLATILRDTTNWLARVHSLQEPEIIILLSPVVIPITQDPSDISDPFEPLGRALARRHAKVRHVPYTQRNGITSTHLGFIKRGHVIILCFVVRPEQQLQLEIADVVFAVSEDKPCIIVICGDSTDMQDSISFPTVILSADYSTQALEMAATLIFGERQPKPKEELAILGPRQMEPVRPKLWPVDQWNEARDVSSVHSLWVENFDRHQLRRTRGVIRLQLGSTFPRTLYGPLVGRAGALTANDEWFRRRGWTLDKNLPGQGQLVYDLILHMRNWTYQEQRSQGPFRYRPCTQDDMARVLELVERASIQQARMGWFDQYFSLMNGPNIKDIVLCLAGDQIVATALTYTPSCGSAAASNLPWAERVGRDVGGVTCVCIFRKSFIADIISFGANLTFTKASERDAIIVGLLNACVMKLHGQGMTKMFLDGVANGVTELKQLGEQTFSGFEEWAIYRDVWKDI
ncbi:acetyltransferase protein [Rutstroemia sp. NJR-2017a BVV2]|nr:acetyltransferase protein [Rutstroemia sp. NJR-2017a BVV2]